MPRHETAQRINSGYPDAVPRGGLYDMRTSTEIGSIARHVGGEEEAVRLVAAAGFDCFDFTMLNMARFDYATRNLADYHHPLHDGDYLAFARHIRRVGEECGIACNQSHAPFPVTCPGIRTVLTRAIECTAEAGGKICVIHPENTAPLERNIELFRSLLPTAKACGVKIAVENMWCWDNTAGQAYAVACSTPDRFLALLEGVDDENFVACLDIGHAEMRGIGTSAPEMIRALGGHLHAIHMHDNDRWHDSHQIPFSMQIDFTAVAEALRDIGYTGEMTLEADQYLNSRKEDDPADCVREMARAARRLAEMCKYHAV